jgi:hypothetical protein
MQELFLLSRSARAKSMVKTKLEHQNPIKMYISIKRYTNNPSILSQITKKKQSARSSQERRIPKNNSGKKKHSLLQK